MLYFDVEIPYHTMGGGRVAQRGKHWYYTNKYSPSSFLSVLSDYFTLLRVICRLIMSILSFSLFLRPGDHQNKNKTPQNRLPPSVAQLLQASLHTRHSRKPAPLPRRTHLQRRGCDVTVRRRPISVDERLAVERHPRQRLATRVPRQQRKCVQRARERRLRTTENNSNTDFSAQQQAVRRKCCQRLKSHN